MKTVLSRFCEQFEHEVRPLLDPVDRLHDRLGALADDDPTRQPVSRLRELRHHLRTLSDKVAGQQAYVIIFGPLKSGKSTLMNALSAAYVSEVTTLPAYPCMVYVGHASERGITVTRYDGSEERFGDLAAVRDVMAQAHVELADRIRAVEKSGEDFDPGRHLPAAVRRVDVRMPAEQLAGSGAVLVDTPGLYSRMKFGYDLMTREFRNAAASAIFVVKTDNLFLEQVFDEFNDLLRLFSRIFLVVNLDSTKRDLQPNGELGPSLENSDPGKIIAAFEQLSMSAELRSAAGDGRLRIYPIDLLQAASRRLKLDAQASATTGARPAATTTGAGPASATTSAPAYGSSTLPADFDRFLGDVTDYLNSTEYLVAFLGDSLRQAQSIVTDLDSLCRERPLVDLDAEVARLRGEREQLEKLDAAARRLLDHRWDETFAKLREDVMRITRERSGPVRRETGEAADGALTRWFESDASYASLMRDDMGEVLGKCRDGMFSIAGEASKTVLGSDVATALVRSELRDDLALLGISFPELGGSALASAHPVSERKPLALDVSPRVVPVRKTFLDWLFFRGQDSVRRRLLGPDDSPSWPIPQPLKQRRLGRARVTLAEAVRSRLEIFFTETSERVAGEVFGTHLAAVIRAVRARLDAAASANTEERRRVETALAARAAVREDHRALTARLDPVGKALATLAREYVQHAPSLLEPASDASSATGKDVASRAKSGAPSGAGADSASRPVAAAGKLQAAAASKRRVS